MLDALALPRAHFLGLSFGGWLLLKLAALAPGRISGAVLLEVGGLTPFTFTGQVVGGVGALLYMLHPSERTLHYAAVTPFYARGRSPDPDLVQFFGLTYRHVTLDLDLSGLPVVSREAIAGLTAPVLVLYGEQSRFFNATKTIERAREIVPNLAVAEIIAGEGHLFSADAERRVYDRIAEFLG